MWQSRGNENETEISWAGVRAATRSVEKGKLNNRKKTTLLFVTFGHSQLKTKPSELNRFPFDFIPFLFSSLPYNTKHGTNAVLSMTDLFLILVHFPLAQGWIWMWRYVDLDYENGIFDSLTEKFILRQNDVTSHRPFTQFSIRWITQLSIVYRIQFDRKWKIYCWRFCLRIQ